MVHRIRVGTREEVCSYLELALSDLLQQEDAQPVLGRWLAYDPSGSESCGDSEGHPVGIVTAFERVDGRCFVTHHLRSESAFTPLLAKVVDQISQPLFVSLREDQPARIAEAKTLGFEMDFRSKALAVPIDQAQRALRRLSRPTRHQIVSAESISRDDLFALDTELRNDVPGNNGWRGNRAWFDAEMASSDYDPTGYVIALADNRPIGLCRFWRDDDGPKLGMLGVTRPFRSGTVAIALLDAALAGVKGWGSPTFSAHTARPALQRRIQRLGGRHIGGYVRLQRELPATQH